MGGNELEVLKFYNRKIEKYRDDVAVLLNCLTKLEKVRVSISLLQDTNIGRTVSGLKKQYGDAEVGVRARDLVLKWKAVVAKEEKEREEEEEEEAEEEAEETEETQERNGVQEPPVYIPTPIVPVYVPTPLDQLRIKPEPGVSSSTADGYPQNGGSSGADTDDQDHSTAAYSHHHETNSNGSRYPVGAASSEADTDDQDDNTAHHRQHKLAAAATVKKEKEASPAADYSVRERERKEKKHKHKDREPELATSSSSRSREDNKKSHKSKKSHRERGEEAGAQHREHKSSSRHTREEAGDHKRGKSSSSHSQHRREDDGEERDKRRRSRDTEPTAAAAAAATTTHCDDIRDSSKSSSSNKTKERSSGGSSSRRGEAETVRVKAEPPDLTGEHETYTGWERKEIKEERRQENTVRIKQEPQPVKVKTEPAENGHGQHKHKDKHRDRDRHKDKVKEREHDRERDKEKKKDRDNKEKEKDKEKKAEKKKKIKLEPSAEEDLFARAMSGLGDEQEEEEEEGGEASHLSSRGCGGKKRPREPDLEYDSEGRLREKRRDTSENGTARSSSSSSKGGGSSSGSRTDFEKFRIPSPPRSLPGPSFTPAASFMPEISPMYKPLPRPPIESRHGQSEEEALDYLMGQKNKNRSAIYSGKKRMRYFQEVPSLFDQCIMVLQDHVEDIDEVGDLNYSVLRPVLQRAPPKTLMHIEDTNPHLMEDTWELWEKHCNKDFRNKQREEMESWREMYERCTAEREEKLDQLKGKVKTTYLKEEKSRRQTKIAYPDMVAKPPRDIARKQARFGTGLPVGHAMKAGGSTAAGGPGGGAAPVKPRLLDPTAGARPPPPSRKPKQPPMMAKVKNMMKGLKGVGFGRR